MKGLWIVCMLVVSAVAIACVGGETGTEGRSETDGSVSMSSSSSGSSTSSGGDGSSSSGGSSSTSTSGGSSSSPQLCAGMSCADAAICIEYKQTGNEACAQTCTTSSECASPSDCCTPINGGGSVCLPYQGYACLCEKNGDCSASIGGPACVPEVQNGVVSSKNFMCAPNDAQAFHGCNAGAGCCPSGFDCWADSKGRNYCAHSCNADTACDNPGVACCTNFGALTATCDNCVAGCSGAGGCTACP